MFFFLTIIDEHINKTVRYRNSGVITLTLNGFFFINELTVVFPITIISRENFMDGTWKNDNKLGLLTEMDYDHFW